MKNAIILAFVLVAFTATVCYAQKSHNITLGNRQPYDGLLYRNYIAEPRKFMRKVTRDVTFPEKGVVNRNFITQIKISDLMKDGTGGYATLYSGGVGYQNVTIHFKSQRGYGMSFLLEIFGRNFK